MTDSDKETKLKERLKILQKRHFDLHKETGVLCDEILKIERALIPTNINKLTIILNELNDFLEENKMNISHDDTDDLTIYFITDERTYQIGRLFYIAYDGEKIYV